MEIRKNKRVRWIDVLKPSAEDLTWLEQQFDLHPVITEEISGPSARARVEAYNDYLFYLLFPGLR